MNKSIQLQYEGFLKTPFLWLRKGVFDLEMFQINTSKTNSFNTEIDTKIRLGKYVERFVSFQLQQDNSMTIVSENIQIQENKITLGELDCILLKDKKPIHLEIVYKFYLYDSSVGTTEIDHFIGPNRKDSLLEKLEKLKEKQLPLLYSKQCKQYIESLELNLSKIHQQLYFKAQLFVPLHQDIRLQNLNPNCIIGFYINRKELEQFTNCKFYIPSKKDWLIVPHSNVNWLNFSDFKTTSNSYLERQFSPLCWIKKENGELSKFFLTFW